MPDSDARDAARTVVETSGAASAGSPGEGGDAADVGVLVAHTQEAAVSDLRSFARGLARDVADELGEATVVPWRFALAEPEPLGGGADRYRPSEFLDDAMVRMIEGSYDLLVVVTDAPVVSRRERVVPGLASPLARVAVVSTRGLAREHRACEDAPLDDAAIRWNGAALLLHLLGHVLGADHASAARVTGTEETANDERTTDADRESAMTPFRFDPSRRSLPRFDADVKRLLRRVAGDIPQADAPRGRLGRTAFHCWSVVRNPREVLDALRASRAPLLPLSLPRLSTAGVAPALILVFSAETWDVGITLSNGAAALFAVVSVVAAAVHVLFVQNLLFPRRPRPSVTEHVALVNATVAAILLGAMAGLFALVGTIVLFVELVVFPPDLMTNWPSLEDPTVGLIDIVRTAVFIATVGMLSGALGGGLEDRAVLRHLALFLDRP